MDEITAGVYIEGMQPILLPDRYGIANTEQLQEMWVASGFLQDLCRKSSRLEFARIGNYFHDGVKVCNHYVMKYGMTTLGIKMLKKVILNKLKSCGWYS